MRWWLLLGLRNAGDPQDLYRQEATWSLRAWVMAPSNTQAARVPLVAVRITSLGEAKESR